MYSFYELQKFCDITIIVNGKKKINAHKIILSSMSKYFDIMFSGNFIENTMKEINIILDIENYESFDEVIKFMYVRRFNYYINDYNILKDMLVLANYFIIDELINPCINALIRISDLRNCIDLYKFSELYNYKRLTVFSYNHIKNNIKVIYKYCNFGNLETNDIIKLLSDKKIIVESEEDIVEILLTWLNFKQDINRFDLYNLIKKVRISLLNFDSITKLKTHPLIVNDNRCISILNSKIKISQPRYSTLGSLIYITDPDKFISDGQIYMNICTYNFVTDEIKTIDDIPYAYDFNSLFYNDVFYFTKFICRNGRVLTDKSFHSYDLLTKQWNKFPELINNRNYATTICDGKLFSIGGILNGEYINDVKYWQIGENNWINSVPIKIPRSNLFLAIHDGEIYALGGKNGELLDIVEKFDKHEMKWVTLAPLPIPLIDGSAIIHDGFIYVIGGTSYIDLPYDIDPTNGASKNMFRYDIIKNTWSRLSSSNFNKVNASLTIINCKIYVVGGDKNNYIEVYDIKKDEWSLFRKSYCTSYSRQTNIFTKKIFI
ncbi:kelch-like protein [Deerpox virus W-1170-84]|uniref:Kelch-like protein n=1 Tax=Deerpox virus (strain W-1170-84) TaxID=305676 RepID=Q08F21_DPV84|nr:kelch-like protein [Deerpox virus W-1170-84]